MTEYIEAIQRLAEQFGRLPGIGRKTAMRMAFSVIELDSADAEEFANAIIEAKQKVHECPICGNLTDKEICSVCSDLERNKQLICVVEDVRAVMSIEKVREFRGVYHVLGGVISPMNGVTPDKIRFSELISRVNNDNVEEVRDIYKDKEQKIYDLNYSLAKKGKNSEIMVLSRDLWPTEEEQEKLKIHIR